MRKNELSLADRVNLALFLLTIMGVILAAWSLRVAQRTLDDARETGKLQQQQFNQQMQTAGKQFKQQTEQSADQFSQQSMQSHLQFQQESLGLDQQTKSSRESLKALIDARTQLEREASLLATLQNTAASQLESAGRQTSILTELNDVRPLPLLEIECDHTTVYRRDSRNSPFGNKVTNSDPTVGKIAIVKPARKEEGNYDVKCIAHLSIQGRVALTGVALELIASGDTLLGVFPHDGGWRHDAKHITPISNEPVYPSLGAGKRDEYFDLLAPVRIPEVGLTIFFDSQNGGSFHEEFKVKIASEK